MMNTTYLEPRLQKLIDLGETGTNIMHGELKNLMLEAEKEYLEAKQIEEDNDYSDAMESMERKYWEGQCTVCMSVCMHAMHACIHDVALL